MSGIKYDLDGVTLDDETLMILGVDPNKQSPKITVTLDEYDTLKRRFGVEYITDLKFSRLDQKVCRHILIDDRGSMGDGYNCVTCGFAFYDCDSIVEKAASKGRLINCSRLVSDEVSAPVWKLATILEYRGRQYSGLI